jgi:hypothetical protein
VIAPHSCHGRLMVDNDISGLRCRCQTFADPMRVGTPLAGEMPYVLLIVRWVQDLVMGAMVFTYFSVKQCNTKMIYQVHQYYRYCYV